MDPVSATNDRLLVLFALEAAVAEARRRRQVVRWAMLAFALCAALGITMGFILWT